MFLSDTAGTAQEIGNNGSKVSKLEVLHEIILPILTSILIIRLISVCCLEELIISVVFLPFLFFPLLGYASLFFFLNRALIS